MDETGFFFKALPEKRLFQKAKGCKGGRKSTQRLTSRNKQIAHRSQSLSSFGKVNIHGALRAYQIRQSQTMCITLQVKHPGWLLR